MKHIRPPLAATPLPSPSLPAQALSATALSARAPSGLPVSARALAAASLADAERRQDLHPADELAQIRAAITQLRIRESALMDHFRTPATITTDSHDRALQGDHYRVRLTPHVKRVFDTSRLPQAVLANPQYYRRERHLLVTTQPKTDKAVPVHIC